MKLNENSDHIHESKLKAVSTQEGQRIIL